MTRDPYSEYTRTSDTWNDDTTSTTSSYYEDPNCTCTYTIQQTSHILSDDYVILIKNLRKKQAILEMKNQWNDFKKMFKPVPKMRPSIQLRGVSFCGRGWA